MSSKIKERNRLILQLRNENWTLIRIGKKFHLSQERVRQIIDDWKDKPLYCKDHKLTYKNFCTYCFVRHDYFKRVTHLIRSRKIVLFEARRLQKLDKRKVNVIQKSIFVKLLKDTLNWNFNRIAQLLKMDNTSITHLYKYKI